MCKFKNKIMTLATFSILAVVAPQSSYAFCFFNCPPVVDQKPEQTLQINSSETREQAAAAQQILIELQKDMLQKMSEVEQSLTRQETGQALRQAKEILDTVRIKVGIDPKVQIQESFLVPIKFSEDTSVFSDLNDNEKTTVIRTIQNFRGGLFMDLLNLSKRTTLLYTQALIAELQNRGGINQEDRDKILRDLTSASVIALPVLDKAGKKLIVFDEDVANEDHIYLFNRELKMFVLSNQQLGMDEKSFLAYKEKVKRAKTPKKVSKPDNSSSVGAYETGLKCMSNAGIIEYNSVRWAAQSKCFNMAKEKLQTTDQCLKLAYKIEYNSVRWAAQSSCQNIYGQYGK